MSEPRESDAIQSAEALQGEPEPWEPWESRLVVWTIVCGITGLIILGCLVNAFILA